ncbi:MAG: hypothetical protein O3A82_16165 [Verrucomicrobia bacterium]|jgi:hypothetical protein|nr:hypothetical protein [Verrucomicrobiota bacterium]MDA0723199.1 hypothetical protein [Verrucomicrobiota bacterium]MDA1048446.1 hypothetical protein [Verrucomicrobiota bacterium]
MKYFRNILIALIFTSTSLFVDGLAAAKAKSETKEALALEQDEVGLKVKGLVCSFCAQGIRKNVSKLNFVDSKKPQKGVRVDEKNGYFVVSLKSGKTPVWNDLFAAVVNAGYDVTEGQSLSGGKIVIHLPGAKK